MKARILITALTLVSFAVIAAGIAKLNGDFTFTPKTPIHKTDIPGKIEAVFEGDTLKTVKLTTNITVVGKTEFSSSEQWFNKVAIPNAGEQIVLAFKLANTPHKFTFVYVGGFQNNRYEGSFYKAPNTTVDEVKELAKDGILAVPAGWLEKGKANLDITAQ